MANKKLFGSNKKKVSPPDTINNAGGKAYISEPKRTLCQIAVTNCFNGTFYASGQDNLTLAKEAALALKDDPEFIAKVAVYCREKGFMKDMAAFLTVFLSSIDKPLFRKVFRKIIDNGKMLRNVIQMARSGEVTGKVANMNAGTYRNAIQEWFDKKSPNGIFKASVGNNPSMRDILRMARPKPNSPEKNALYGYLVGKNVEFAELPELVQKYERWKGNRVGPIPDVDFRLLDSLNLGTKEWTEIAVNAPWMMTRMNLNTFARHGVFKDKTISELVANRLKNKELISQARAFPYQLFVAWRETTSNVDIPYVIKESLQDAMEISIDSVPVIEGNIQICVDTSGSMGSPVTGYRNGSSSGVTCVEVAALIASAIIRKNRNSTVWTFNNQAVRVPLNPRDSVTTNCTKLSNAGGGTNVSAPLRTMNVNGLEGVDAVIYVSDYESWLDSTSHYGTGLADEWNRFKARNPKSKLICFDLTPRNNTQIKPRKDVLQIGGFSDTVFEVMSSFLTHGLETDHWVKLIENVVLD